jgi:hypothetical protein
VVVNDPADEQYRGRVGTVINRCDEWLWSVALDRMDVQPSATPLFWWYELEAVEETAAPC